MISQHRIRGTDVLLYCVNVAQYFIFKMSSVPILPRPLISICGTVVYVEVSYILKLFDSKNYTLITLRVIPLVFSINFNKSHSFCEFVRRRIYNILCNNIIGNKNNNIRRAGRYTRHCNKIYGYI